MQRTDSTTSSTANLRDSDYNADEALRRTRAVGPRPAPPKQRLHAEMNPKLRDLDWNGHTPTAPVRTVAEWGDDSNQRAIPTVPRQRQATPSSHWDAADIYERPAAWNAFGSAA
jgi:hypothetical protein